MPKPSPLLFLAELLKSWLPYLKAANARVSAWAAEASWKRIALLGFVIFLASLIIGSILGLDEENEVISGPSKPIKFDIKEDPTGLTIQPSVDGKPTKSARIHLPPMPARPDHPPAPPRSPESPSASGGATAEVDKDAIQFEKDGKKIVIDSHGVRVIDSNSPPAAKSGEPPSPAGDQDASEDSEEAAEQRRRDEREQIQSAVEQAKDEIQDAVDEAAAATVQRTKVRRESAAVWDFFKVLLTIAFAYLIAIKVSTNNKRRAEEMVKSASQHAEHESLQRQVVEARMQTMQAQVEPHFLFNTLSSVDYLIETDPARASTMQKNLIQYLRAALPQMREASTTLGREVDLVRAYLDILKVRMEERLQVSIEVTEGLRSADFPPMMLQSLVENAIKHGLEPKAEGGSIRITGEVADGDLHVVVADTGLGFNPSGAPTSGGGLGLANIRERLALLYAGRAKFVITANEPSGTQVAIIVPYLPTARRK